MSTSSPMVTLEQATWAWIMAGPAKHRLSIGKRFVKAFMAGLFLSTGGMLVQVLSADPWLTENAAGLLKIIQGAVFPVGLVMIVLLQMDLVTGQMAIMTMATIKRKVPYWAWLADWALVFVGNLAGALLYTGIVYGSGIYTPAMKTGAAGVATMKAGSSISFGKNIVRAIGCNTLVCLAVFQASLAKDAVSKVVCAWFPIFVFVAAGFEHVVASMFLIPEGLENGAMVTVGRYIGTALVPAFLGNVIGAWLLVLPLMYLYGGDEFDPAKTTEEKGSPSPTIHEPMGQVQSGHYVKDIERAEP